ncbi:MBL fold metallo-hydrolase [bacterium]|nr:MBL fold metallo-hydrolase [bacterium]
MNKIIIVLLILLFAVTSYAQELTISVVYNNVSYDENLTCAWGISCLIEGMEETILFDAGGDGDILLSNIKRLGIAPEEIDIVVLSHIHGDHVGGLWEFLKTNSDVEVYLPSSFPQEFTHRVNKSGVKVIKVDAPVEICKDVYSTGQLGFFVREQSLILKRDRGLVVITGCSHPGVANIAKRASQILNNKIYLITGGFHLSGATEGEIKKIIGELKALEVEKIAPNHCTGERAMEMFRKAWGKNFLEAGCGAKIHLRDD